ncbi:MAG TPA: RecX family transcriptional regulator [Bryobacteraceae bacterium]|jgi:regulatory protein|nr:RecX family transcriptional regulator [Bryobacteraceae bacterium]
MRSKPKKYDADALWSYALRALGQRSHSAHELRQKLAARAENPGVLQEVLAKLREYGFADDAAFSETFAASRLNNKGFGKQRVLRDLQAKRVPSAVAGQAVERTFAGTDERELATQFLRRKYRGKDLPEFLKEEKNLASAFRRLRTAGFSARVSLSVLKEHSQRSEDWEPPEEEE